MVKQMINGPIHYIFKVTLYFVFQDIGNNDSSCVSPLFHYNKLRETCQALFSLFYMVLKLHRNIA